MSHSNSSLNCFANCMKKYEHSYILHTPPCKPVSPHLTFGIMAHDVLHKAGDLRDSYYDKVLMPGDYVQVIPSEVLYPELKDAFSITSWERYFMPVIKETAKYEQEIVQKMPHCRIEREVKFSITPEQLKEFGITGIDQTIVGIIDCLIYNENSAVILDYKFSANRKSQDDFDMNSQLPLYAFFVHTLYDIPLHNIQYGYIDIPKQMCDEPVLLSNGTLSRSKSQNCTQDMYERAVTAIHGNDPKYNCEPGGYYYDAWCNMALNKPAYLSIQYLDEEVYAGVLKDLFDAARTIDTFIRNKMVFCKKYDSYSCGSCEYVNSCKPWRQVNNDTIES